MPPPAKKRKTNLASPSGNWTDILQYCEKTNPDDATCRVSTAHEMSNAIIDETWNIIFCVCFQLWSCICCKKEFKQKKNVVEHHKKRACKKRSFEATPDSDGVFQCDRCPQSCKKYRSLRDHILVKHHNPEDPWLYVCGCGKFQTNSYGCFYKHEHGTETKNSKGCASAKDVVKTIPADKYIMPAQYLKWNVLLDFFLNMLVHMFFKLFQ